MSSVSRLQIGQRMRRSILRWYIRQSLNMPLGSSVSDNIHELVHHGRKKRSHRQIVAIAMNAARRNKRKGARRRR